MLIQKITKIVLGTSNMRFFLRNMRFYLKKPILFKFLGPCPAQAL